MNPTPQSGSAQRRVSGRGLLFTYTASISALGVALFVAALRQLPSSLPDTLLFIGLVVVAELTTSAVFSPQMAFSMSSAVIFATLLQLGLLPATLVAIVGGSVMTLMMEVNDRRRDRRSGVPFLQRVLFNMGVLGLAAALAGALYLSANGRVGEVLLVSNIWPMVLAALCIEIVNAALVVGAVALQTGDPPFRLWRQNVSWAIPINIMGMIVGGGGVALGYEIAGVLGVAIFFLPLALTIYAFRLYVSRTKSHVEQLEQNIVEREQAEEQLRASLKEKEVLLQEIHHRVKNNLQIMSSLLYLQARGVEDKETLHMLMESRNRVRSMALVHEKLYQSTDLSKINFAQYVRSLGNYLLRSFGVDPGVIHLRSDVDDVFLSIDTAVPCGLIINELVSNSLQHAFPHGRSGEVGVELHSGEKGQFLLTVRDDGVGMPDDVDTAGSQSLGLQLVNTLVDQLEGTIEIDKRGGTTVLVVFKELRDRYTPKG